MDKELKAKWVAELRRVDIKQTAGRLLSADGGLCCIGVLGRICGIGDDVLLDNPYLGGDHHDVKSLHALGIVDYDTRYALARMNDSGKTFPEIADYIEANL